MQRYDEQGSLATYQEIVSRNYQQRQWAGEDNYLEISD